MRTRSTVTVRGRVQGVSFRYHTTRAAARNQVSGWVANLSDGSVKACFEGEADDVEAMVEWCRRGPELARVDELSEQKGEYAGEFTGFEIRGSDE
ncbi:acylphosphatase [Citrifermentans bremense]|uniref:acylphosphatase n=1 Tax=Citrifermentans bremense TaxID=60035 RepID=UPI00047DB774|nr:acylphosphatase [Citrifermentans bremense]